METLERNWWLCRAFNVAISLEAETEPGDPVELPSDVEPPKPTNTAADPAESETDRIWNVIRRAAGG